MSATSNDIITKSNGAVVISATDASLLPHLESWERMMKLPVVEAAWTQSQGVYDKVRGEFLHQCLRRQVKSSVTVMNKRRYMKN